MWAFRGLFLIGCGLALSGCQCRLSASLVKTCPDHLPCPIGKKPDGLLLTTTCQKVTKT